MTHYPWSRFGDRQQDGRLSVVTEATGDVVSLSDAKLHLRVDQSDEDSYIQGLIAAAASEIDSPRGWLGRSLLTKTLRLTLDSLPPHTIALPGVPVQSVDKVEYRDTSGTLQTVDASDYEFDLQAEPALIWPARSNSIAREHWADDMDWHGPDLFRVEYTAGYGTDADIPQIIKQWILLRVGDMYRDRETSIIGTSFSDLSHPARMLDNYRVRV